MNKSSHFPKRKSLFALIQLSVLFSSFMIVHSSSISMGRAELTDPPPWLPWNVEGTQTLVVILTEFSDVSHTANVSVIRTRLENMASYFHKVSFGKISINFTLLDDMWLRLNNTMAYYGQGIGKNDQNGWQFIVDSVKAWESFINFSDYDYLTVIHAGEDQSSYPNETELLWRRDFGFLGHSRKTNVMTEQSSYGFWGLAYDSEFEEWGLMTHEFGHSLGLPDLYVENKSLGIDSLSLMARGDRNGNPEGTSPSSLDAFSMYLLGWLNPSPIILTSTKDIVEMNSSASSSPTIFKVLLWDSEYYLIEIREKSGIDNYTLSSTSLVAYIVNNMRESAGGIVDIPNGGVVVQGGFYSDISRSICASFVSYNSSTHIARVGLSTRLYFVRISLPDSIDYFSTITGKVRVFDGNNNPVQYAPLNVTVDENISILRVTDENGEATFELNFNELGFHAIRVTSPSMLAGETEKMILVSFPWQLLAIALLSIALFVLSAYTLIKYIQKRRLILALSSTD